MGTDQKPDWGVGGREGGKRVEGGEGGGDQEKDKIFEYMKW